MNIPCSKLNYLVCQSTRHLVACCVKSRFVLSSQQFSPPIALRTDLLHITTELWEIPVLRMAH